MVSGTGRTAKMKRIPPAARQLVAQVSEHGKTTVEIVGEPDGFGIYRSVQFDAKTAAWLVPALDAIRDVRIDAIDEAGKKAVVTFVSDTRADKRTPYPLSEVKAILGAKKSVKADADNGTE